MNFVSQTIWATAARVLTLADLTLLLDIPGVQSSSLLVLHGCAFVEMLRKMGLVESCGLHHLSLREVVLLHVAFHYFCNMPWVCPIRERHHFCVCFPLHVLAYFDLIKMHLFPPP